MEGELETELSVLYLDPDAGIGETDALASSLVDSGSYLFVLLTQQGLAERVLLRYAWQPRFAVSDLWGGGSRGREAGGYRPRGAVGCLGAG